MEVMEHFPEDWYTNLNKTLKCIDNFWAKVLDIKSDSREKKYVTFSKVYFQLFQFLKSCQ